MLGGMQDWDLRVTHLIDYAEREHGSREIVTRWADGSISAAYKARGLIDLRESPTWNLERIAKAKGIADAVVTDGKSLSEIKRAAVVAKSGPAMADKSEAYIDAAFDLLADAKPTGPAAKALADAAKRSAPTDRDTIYADRAKALADAWKPQMKKEGV